MARYKIKDLPEHERPRERLEANGAAALSSAELLAIILRTGTSSSTAIELANEILAQFGSLKAVSNASMTEITRTKGIGPAKACQVAAAFELGRRAAGHTDSRRPKITGPRDIADIVRPQIGSAKQENFLVALLNAKNELLRIEHVTRGTLTASLIHPRETFSAAITEGCFAVILIHNHPTGDSDPSTEDVKITRKLSEAGSLLGIKVLDHIIIGEGDSFSSMKDKGVIS